MYLVFSNDPNWDGDGDPTGTSEKVTTVVFTYSPIVNKVMVLKGLWPVQSLHCISGIRV